jgi:hypothetical protein
MISGGEHADDARILREFGDPFSANHFISPA